MVEAAPVNLGELGEVGEVVFFGFTGLPVEIGAWLLSVVGQALTVIVTTDGTIGLEEMMAAGPEVAEA